MPALFLSHGSPMLALEDEPTTAFLRSLPERLPRPDAIVVASAHWETGEAVVGGAAHPETLHDFHGFPEALYALRYPAPGQPRLAARMRDLLVRAGFATTVDPVRGLDHGAWNPLLLMYPEADIPVVQLSVQPCRDADWHYRVGRALAPLGRDNILLIGSGNLTHNLREAFDGRHAHAPDWVVGFAEWVAGKTEARDIDALLEWQARAPDARRNHPTTEHFVPFLVALGAAGAYRRVERLNREFQMGVLAMDAYVFSE